MKNLVFIIIVLGTTSLFSDIIPITSYNFELNFDENCGFNALSGRDEIIAELDVPDLKGITPMDICFIPTRNEIYVYGERKILIFDCVNFTLLTTINISSSTTLYSYDAPAMVGERQKLCYIPEYDKIACHSNDGQLIIIEPSSAIIIYEEPYPFPMTLEYINIKFNSRDNNIYINCVNMGDACLLSYNINEEGEVSNNYVKVFENSGGISDIAFNPYRDRIYVGFTYSQEIKIINSVNGIEINSIPALYNVLDIEFIDNGETLSTILATPQSVASCQLISIDAINDFSYHVYSIPHNTLNKICHDFTNDKIIIGGVGYIYVINDEYSVTNPPNPLAIMFGDYESRAIDIMMNENVNRLYVSHRNGFTIIDAINYELLHNEISQYGNFIKISLNNINNYAYIISMITKEIAIIDNSCHPSYESLGCDSNLGLHCSNANKMLFYKAPTTQISDIVALDLNNNSIEIINEVQGVSGLAYDEITNKVYISSALDNVIRVMDATTNTFLSNEYITFQSVDDDCQGIYISPNRILFCVLETKKVARIDLTQQPYNIVYDNVIIPGTKIINPHFLVYENNSEIWISVKNYGATSPEDNISRMYVFNDNSIQGILRYFHLVTAGQPISHMEYMEISGESNVIFDVKPYLFKIDENEVVNQIDPGFWVLDFDASNCNSIYMIKVPLDDKLYQYDLALNEITDHQMPGHSFFPYYNSINDIIYTLTINPSNNYSIEISTYNCSDNSISSYITSSTYNHNSTYNGLPPVMAKGIFALNPDDNILCMHPGDNVIKITECDTEIKTLSRGWNWESFPRLERDKTINEEKDIVSVLRDIQNFGNIELLDMWDESILLRYEFLPYSWTYNPYDVKSTKLYKIDVDPEDDWLLNLPGSRMEPDYEFPQNEILEANTFHWIGYWLPDAQDMDVAFGPNWEYVEEVKAEEWYYGPQPSGGRDLVIGHKPSLTMRALEYGKGYEVKFSEEIEDFRWFCNEVGEGYERPDTENFTYAELPDYEVIDVMDIPENVIEIGVYQDSICVGAVVVQDSCEQILVYVDNSSRDQVPYNFEVVTNNRSFQEVLEYMVFNLDEGLFENRSLIAGSQPYSIIIFGNLGEPQNELPIIDKVKLHGNYPNPFNPVTNISFCLPEEQKIELAIYNLKGQKVAQIANGHFASGEHKVTWDGKDDHDKKVASGLYFYKLKTNNKEISKKMLLLK
ncbi:T9SS type A sorting domain-containing protein [Candidatus Cloacimonadota bacterium]